jgi:2-polyprenyl-3-methyl-5-hydroxy-6-metoxy-1,4-benzoquinol methylase
MINQDLSYYQHIRQDILPLLPKQPSRILDVGAGSGATLAWLKTIFPQAQTTGIELNPALVLELEKNADIAVIGDIDKCYSRLARYDLILFLDVLEHLTDSLGTLKKLSKTLEPGGCVIVSVPNLAHLSVSLPLLLRRQFAYRDAGILDRTHLRFFVETSAIALLNDANFRVTKGLAAGLTGPRSRILDLITFGLLRHHLTKQYIMLGELTGGRFGQQKVHWMKAA